MKFAASILLGLLAVSASQGKSLNPWDQKARDLELKFDKVVDHKAQVIIEKIKTVVHNAQGHVKNFVEGLEREINATVASALQEIEVLKLDVDLECYTNASRDIYAAQQAAFANLMGCQNLSVAYTDFQEIAQNATVVILDVAKDAKLIVEGVAECSAQTGFDKWDCVFKYVSEELEQLIFQWPDAKRFIAVVESLSNDAEIEIDTCLETPTQQSLDVKVEEAISEFSACSQKSSSRFGKYLVN